MIRLHFAELIKYIGEFEGEDGVKQMGRKKWALWSPLNDGCV